AVVEGPRGALGRGLGRERPEAGRGYEAAPRAVDVAPVAAYEGSRDDLRLVDTADEERIARCYDRGPRTRAGVQATGGRAPSRRRRAPHDEHRARGIDRDVHGLPGQQDPGFPVVAPDIAGAIDDPGIAVRADRDRFRTAADRRPGAPVPAQGRVVRAENPDRPVRADSDVDRGAGHRVPGGPIPTEDRARVVHDPRDAPGIDRDPHGRTGNLPPVTAGATVNVE